MPYRQLMLQAYAQHPDAFTSSASERAALPLAWWRDRLQANGLASQVVFGAFDNVALVGAVGLSFEAREKTRHKANLFGMVVQPGYRGAGIGRQLLSAALQFLAMRPEIKLVQLTVTQGNAAATALYQGMGFMPFGLEPFAVATDSGYVDKVHMWHPLDPQLGELALARNPG